MRWYFRDCTLRTSTNARSKDQTCLSQLVARGRCRSGIRRARICQRLLQVDSLPSKAEILGGSLELVSRFSGLRPPTRLHIYIFQPLEQFPLVPEIAFGLCHVYHQLLQAMSYLFSSPSHHYTYMKLLRHFHRQFGQLPHSQA